MRGAPRGESVSRSEPGRGRGIARSERLRTPQQFAALAGERATWRSARELVAISARVNPGPSESEPNVYESTGTGLRFGFTVGRRQARRAVQRTLVKRVLREAARHGAAVLRPLLQGRRIDVVLRLRGALPAASEMGLRELKRTLRSQADWLLAQLARHLRCGHVAAGSASRAESRPEHAGGAADRSGRIR
jgi:ribonuclease P protein component